MKRSQVALGQAVVRKTISALSANKMSSEDRMKVLEEQVARMQEIITSLRRELRRRSQLPKKPVVEGLNKDGIPIGLNCWAVTEKNPYYIIPMQVEANGYQVNNVLYASLSAAAEGVSGVRRSGWTFWRLPDGRTLREVYKI